MQDRVRVWAEGGRAGVLVKRQRWTTLARFHGEEAERMARDLGELIAAGRLITGRDLEPEESTS